MTFMLNVVQHDVLHTTLSWLNVSFVQPSAHEMFLLPRVQAN